MLGVATYLRARKLHIGMLGQTPHRQSGGHLANLTEFMGSDSGMA